MITMMIGIAGSGKSTWAKENRPNAIIISTDEIRAMLYGNASSQKNPKRVFAVAFNEINKAVSQGFDVVFDATNITRNDRRKAFAEFPKDVEVEAVFINTDKEVALVRNTQRDRFVPPVAICGMYKRLEAPLLEEGFCQITEINTKKA